MRLPLIATTDGYQTKVSSRSEYPATTRVVEQEGDKDVFDLAPDCSAETGIRHTALLVRLSLPVTNPPPLHRHNTPPKPKREPPLPLAPETSLLRPALKAASPMALSSMELPLLLNCRSISGFTVDSSSSGVRTAIPGANSPVLHLPPAQILVQLETASWSLCTTMHTHSDFLSSLNTPTALVAVGASASASPFSMSPFFSAFQAHQEATDLRTTTSDQKPSRMHIFLDRPSSPYIHILSFLRSITASCRLTLPRGLLQMPASSAARMEELFGLRDEARYLGMTILEKLCEEKISRRQAERSARHGHGSAATCHLLLFSYFVRGGAAGAAAKQRLYIHGSKSAEGVYTGSLGSRGGLGSGSVEHIPRNVFTPEPTTPMRNMDPSIPTSDINAGVGIGGAVPIRPLGLASRRRSSSVTRPLPPLSPGGRI
ncbi:hypothetical protein BS47DRAFT_1388496 [Hydnum rufescens UP504]|uniref:Uncharacterized protein n=1 Tax=Hydnum rufescens UP504 TaxID=1448309 RepID=A0A9P6B7S4_9AGAM|nr:hypothetical protein BS47DRAFT_1388496 [Hydnum rufescens UP504]